MITTDWQLGAILMQHNNLFIITIIIQARRERCFARDGWQELDMRSRSELDQLASNLKDLCQALDSDTLIMLKISSVSECTVSKSYLASVGTLWP